MRLHQTQIHSNQEFVSNIAQSAYVTTSDSTKVPRPILWSNADEADLHVWLHCMHSQGYCKLICSPDTDVYHIGLTVISQIPNTQVIVQLSKVYSEDARLLCLTHF